MDPLKAHVRNGRLMLDEPTALPEGSEVTLVPVDADDLDDDDRAQLHAALRESENAIAAGQVIDGAALLDELRRGT